MKKMIVNAFRAIANGSMFIWSILYKVWGGVRYVFLGGSSIYSSIRNNFGRKTAYSTVCTIAGSIIGFFVGGIGVTALGRGVGLYGFLVFAVIGAILGMWAGGAVDRLTSKSVNSVKTVIEPSND